MAYISTLIPVTFVRSIQGLGVTQSEYNACLAAQAAYQRDLSAWNTEQAAYTAAVLQRQITIAAQTATYNAAYAAYVSAHDRWVKAKATWNSYLSQLASIAAGYAMTTAQVTAKYGQILSGTPTCVPKDWHTKLANECYNYSNPVKGLGAFDWRQYETRELACFGAALPTCVDPPLAPPQPGPEPMPPVKATPPPDVLPLRPKPTAPSSCIAPTPVAVPAPVVAVPAPVAVPVVIPKAQPDEGIRVVAPAAEEAAMAPAVPIEAKAGGGLLVAGLLVLAVGGGIYLMSRRRPATT
jgi:hypothetical protein